MCRPSLHTRSAAAAVEFAFILPIIAFILLITIDYSRVFYSSLTVANCARNGALYACDPYSIVKSPYNSVTEAALADASNLSPAPMVTSANGVDGAGRLYVEVTVNYPFQTVTNYPGIPSETTIVRKCRMLIAPQTPE